MAANGTQCIQQTNSRTPSTTIAARRFTLDRGDHQPGRTGLRNLADRATQQRPAIHHRDRGILESVFRVRIGKPHRRWQSIASRKKLSYTKFLDQCKQAIGKRVDEEMGK